MPWKHPPEAEQQKFIEEYRMLLSDASEWKHHILFYDPVHQVHNSVSVRCRIEKWTECILKSNTWRKRITVMWWINAITMDFSGLVTEDNCDAEMTKVTLDAIRWDYSDNKKIYLILDNARYNHAQIVVDHAEKLNISLKFLPAYAPNLNLIERLRKYMKKELVNNKYYEKYDEFYEALIAFFVNLKNHKNDLKTLLRHKFQILKAV